MSKYKNAIILLNLLLLLAFVNWSIASKEKTLSSGQLVLLPLAPVDPRSLMQGDYMQLRYSIADSLSTENSPVRGLCVVTLDEHQVGVNTRLYSNKMPLAKNEVLIKYFQNGWQFNIGAESYFFEEGKGEKFVAARYGGIRVDADGNSVLQGLYDSAYHQILP